MSDSEEDVCNLTASECQKAIDEFVAVTGGDEAMAQFFLQDHKWDVNLALNDFFAKNQGGASEAAPITISTKAPDKFSLLCWNIDGLCPKNLKQRYQEVVKIIETNKYAVVFLQEVVAESLRYFEDHLENYNILATEETGCEYFTATLLRSGCIYMDGEPEVTNFPGTRMGRCLHTVRAHIGKAKIVLLNTHLESTADHSDERLKQLRFCFRCMSDEDPSEVSTIFGGDLNLRDKELNEMKGIPNGIVDLWTATGSRPECKYTWDMTRNTNLEFPGRFKPRARFDRLYMLPSSPARIKPIHFGLVGLERVTGTQSFPSDHWGIEVHFQIPANK